MTQLNMFVIKRWAGLLIASFIPTLSFAIGVMFYGYWWAIGLFLITSVIAVFISGKILSNPFTQMLEGKGLLCLNIDSTGVVRPFILGLDQPYVKGKLGKEPINDIYDRSSVLNMANPVKAGQAKTLKSGDLGENEDKEKYAIELRLTESEFNSSRFGLFHYPLLIYNNQAKSLITKELLSENEKGAFAEHGVLYLNRKMEELTSIIRDFGRYIVELTKPKESIWKSKWVWIIMLIVGVLFLVLLGKPIIAAMQGTGSAALGAFSNAGAVVPR